jgi:peptidoglycan hydrolase-like protein with peptidoglycan-binding domain
LAITQMTSPGQRLRERTKPVRSAVFGAVGAVGLVAVLTACGASTPKAASAAKPAAAQQPVSTSAPVTPAANGPLTVTSISPASGAGGVATNASLTVNYSAPLDATPPTPKLSPAVTGTWAWQGSAMTFTPAAGWMPWSTETVTVPAAKTAVATFHVQAGSQTRLEQLLAGLHYLPFTFEPAAPLPSQVNNTAATTTTVISTSAQPGTLKWSWSTVPATLRALWKPGHVNVMDQGAVMAFQSDHHMTMDGIAGPNVWSALIASANAHQNDPHPYDYLVASKARPETLKVYREGQVIYSTLANTGVPGADTQAGTFPVYERFASTTMTGTNVDGSKYVDHGIPWVAYFNGGDAVHGFVRPSYGHPQSNGCVELPISNAAKVWQMDPYGTLVTVT